VYNYINYQVIKLQVLITTTKSHPSLLHHLELAFSSKSCWVRTYSCSGKK